MLILASASPRRKELLSRLGISFEVCPVEADESVCPLLSPEETVKTLALRKAAAAAEEHPDDLVLGADTVVAQNGAIFGKPKDAADAARMLHALSGKTHEVYTGYALIGEGKTEVGCSVASVRFKELDEEEIARYIATGEPADKAGAYGIQGVGGLFVEGIHGDYNTVVGLPLCEIYKILRKVYGVGFG